MEEEGALLGAGVGNSSAENNASVPQSGAFREHCRGEMTNE